MKRKFPREVYCALKDAGHSNRTIADLLGVNEASVRRGLKDYKPRTTQQQFVITVTPVD